MQEKLDGGEGLTFTRPSFCICRDSGSETKDKARLNTQGEKYFDCETPDARCRLVTFIMPKVNDAQVFQWEYGGAKDYLKKLVKNTILDNFTYRIA